MKTEEQLLLTYMYQEGYTEEDMYDERVLQKALRSTGFYIFKIRPTVKEMVIKIVTAFKKMSKVVKSIWSAVSAALESVDEYTELQERPNYTNFRIPPTKYWKRPVTRDQVSSRKPNHMIRKIIH